MLTPIAMNFKGILTNFQSCKKIRVLSSDLGACLSIGSFKGDLEGILGGLEGVLGDLGGILGGSWGDLGGCWRADLGES